MEPVCRGLPDAMPRNATRRSLTLLRTALPVNPVAHLPGRRSGIAPAQSFLTERGQTGRVVFATGHRRDREVTDRAATAAPGTALACHMGVSCATDLQSGLIWAGWPEGCPIAGISKVQTPEQRVLRGGLTALARLCQSEQNLNPAILLIRWNANQTARSAVRFEPEGITAQLATRTLPFTFAGCCGPRSDRNGTNAWGPLTNFAPI